MAVEIQIFVHRVISVHVPDLPEGCELKTEVLCFVTCGREREGVSGISGVRRVP